VQERLPQTRASIRDVYVAPSIEKLAKVIDAETRWTETGPAEIVTASRFQHVLCGLLQYGFYVAVSFVYLVIGIEAFTWQAEAQSLLDAYLRSVTAAVATLAFSIALPVIAKWLLVGRWREERIPIWSLRYFRFWVVKQLVQTSPLVLFRGQPIYNTYLRLLGARIGRNASINCRFAPVCTDLLSVGEGAVLAKDCLVQGYRAEHGVIRTGAITVGAGAYVGEASVLEIASTIGERGQLAHASSLQLGQVIPDDGRFWGSPATPTSGEFVPAKSIETSALRPRIYSVLVLALLILAVLPAFELAALLLARAYGHARALLEPFASESPLLMSLSASLAVFVLGLIGGLAIVVLLPRILAPLVKKDKLYPLYGFHYAAASLQAWFSNSYVYNIIFGDSSFIVHYLRAIGLDLSIVKQTGSNFGSHQKHDAPALCRIGSGTMASDGLSIVNFRQSATSFKLAGAAIGSHCFLGNQIIYLAGAKLGDNTLLATKVLVPCEGPERTGVGLLGSPPFEIPRSVVTERAFDPLAPTPERARRLTEKNWHNLVTITQYLLLIWGSSLVTLYVIHAVYLHYETWGNAAVLAASAAMPILSTLYFVLMERYGPGRLALEPRNCTIHDLHFWRVERYWKMGETPLKIAFKGTPFRPMIYRMLGVDVGRMVFDDGCIITEKELTHIGDYCCLNEATSLQCHSLEDGLFKSDHIRIGNGCTIALGGFVNYGTAMQDRSMLLADAFLMKGSTVGTGETWGGNPARRL